MKQNIIKLSVFLFIFFLKVNAFSQPITQVNYISLGWNIELKDNGSVNFVCGPSTPPIIKGSLELNIAATTDRVRFRTNRHDNTFLKDITELEYSTFIASNTNDNAPILTLQIDNDGIDTNGDGQFENDYNINYNPKFHGAVDLNLWQPWNALVGEWSFFKIAQLPTEKNYFVNPRTGAEITDLSTLGDKNNTISFANYLKIKKNENAMIINPDPGGPVSGGGIRFTAGGGNLALVVPNEWKGFKGNIDAFKITKVGGSQTIYDFELDGPSIATIKEQTVCKGRSTSIGSTPVSGSTYSWTSWSLFQGKVIGRDEGLTDVQKITANISVAPLMTTFYTLTETTSNGCVYVSTVKIIVRSDIVCLPVRGQTYFIPNNYVVIIVLAICGIAVAIIYARRIRRRGEVPASPHDPSNTTGGIK